MLRRQFRHARKRRLPQPAPRHVDDAQETQRVARIVDHAQICDDILDLAPIVKPHRAHHRIGHARCVECLLDVAGLRVRPIEHGNISVLDIEHRMQTLYLAHDKGRLVLLRRTFVDDNRIALHIVRPQSLFLAIQIVFDDCVRRLEDILCRAVVLLEQDDCCLRIVALEIEDIAHIRAAPAVDGLIRIAHNADVPVSPGKEFRDLILRPVRVLILVHKDVAELLLILFPYLCVLRKHRNRQHQEIVKIERVVRTQLRLVKLIDLRDLLGKEIARARRELYRRQELVLRIRDMRLHRPRRRMLLVDIQLFEALANETFAVRRIVDDKIFLIAL